MKILKIRLGCAFLLILFTFTICSFIYAEQDDGKLEFIGSYITKDSVDASLNLDNNYYVYLTDVLNALDIYYRWDSDINTVIIIKGGNRIQLKPNTNYIYSRGDRKDLGYYVKLIEGRTLIPVSFFENYLECKVDLRIENTEVNISSYDLFPFKTNDKWGFINRNGNVVIEPIYDDICYISFNGGYGKQFNYGFGEGLAAVKVGKKWGYINMEGQIVIEPQFDAADEFNEGYAEVGIGEDYDERKFTYIDKNGVKLTDFIYENRLYGVGFSEGIASYRKNGKFGYINKLGEIIADAKYLGALYFTEGLAGIRYDDGKGIFYSGYINNNDELVIRLPKDYEISSVFSEGLASVVHIVNSYNFVYGYINHNGEFKIKEQYDLACRFSEGIANIKKGGMWGFIDMNGNYIAQPQYFESEDFFDGLAAVQKNGKWGFIDRTGKEIIPLQYDDVRPFDEGLAAVYKEYRWGFIDRNGELVIDFKYDKISAFHNGLAQFQLDGKMGYIDKSGKLIFEINRY